MPNERALIAKGVERALGRPQPAVAEHMSKLAAASSSYQQFAEQCQVFGRFDKDLLDLVYEAAQKRGDGPGVPPDESHAPEATSSALDQELDRQWYQDDTYIPDPGEYDMPAPATVPGARDRSDGQEIDTPVRVFVRTDSRPPFLAGMAATTKKGPVSVFRDPEGRLAEAARGGSPLVRLRRSQREREKQAQKSSSARGTTLGQLMEKSTTKQTDMPDKRDKAQLSHDQILEQQKSLPVFGVKDKLLSLIRQNQVIVVVGETGSGKTTQLPQYLYEAGFADQGVIACTQPRRVAAMSVAERVAEELGVKLGTQVGYTIRFEDKTSNKTKIKFMTDGILLRECLSHPLLDKYSCIIIDEAHERTLSTDVLLGLFRRILSQRADLKIIVTSATINAARFSNFFGGAPQFTVSGRTFPVHIHHLRTPVDDYVAACVKQVLSIHLQQGPGDILVFMTGQEDIETTCQELGAKLKLLDAPPPLEILPIYSQLPSDLQARIFLPAPPGTRKVIVSTNIAETSITVDGVKFVVDCGFTKVKVYKPNLGVEVLQNSPISQAAASQRAGRAGRTSEGRAFRMYTQTAEENEMYEQPIPEVLRTNLSNIVLLLKTLDIDDVNDFNFLDAPDNEAVTASLSDLWALGALDNAGKLTPLGLQLSKFPMDPYLARLIVESVKRGCSEEMVAIVAMMSVPNVFQRSKERARESDAAREKFFVSLSDHLTLLNVYNQWRLHKFSSHWATENFLHERSLRRAMSIRQQLIVLIKSVFGRPLQSAGSDWNVVRRCIASGYFHQAAKARGLRQYVGLRTNVETQLHPTSALAGLGHIPQFVVYHELVLTSGQYMTTVTAVEPEWLLEDGVALYHGAEDMDRPQAHTTDSEVQPAPQLWEPEIQIRRKKVEKSHRGSRSMRGA